MNRLIVLLIGLLLVVPLSWADEPQVVEIEVTGMTCPFCVYGTEKQLNKLQGVESADVSLKNKRARIVMKPGESADLEAIRKAIVAAGFTPGEAILQPDGSAK
ncbi:heavy-metal-associated domain-containing protein [endosymbiont of Ridgeia piscesae]|jgi:copper chaperone CopZ|uniref:Copper chaperone CopZ n=1 Tax=endosymbiont of Ridgeia piscesae TaxID=54398 RepID=A0A0T5Z8U6_9GAMM|nr:heavy metal-associated domain-containing protein [endosymbiont of Ridgeia piscesae]KRT56625.1 Copper chaperone CopZ [endosymbiont of Ridgeia piscesae]KRT59073.1 Copper chaperone CopZ [endosymbiont of Ridgeia piscesae]